jgi:Chromo (CHRromatin Organisation MOdifier) domain
VLSANAEEEARAMADGAVLRKVVKSKKRKYFVKWRGLSYRDSTWETAKVMC